MAAAETDRRVLIVSTDPAHSLFDVLHLESRKPGGPRRLPPGPAARVTSKVPQHPPSLTRIPTRRGGLVAVELDADRALQRWLGPRRQALRTIVARGTYLDDDDIDRFLALSLPGVDELIGLVELERLAAAAPWDDVVVDTAPTGHALRLLAMPGTLGRIAGVLDVMLAKHRFLAESLGGRYRPDTADALVAEIERESDDLGALLRDPARCSFSWLLLPEVAALEEARDGVSALEDANITVGEIIVNRVTPPPSRGCVFCAARRRSESDVIAATRAAFPGRSLVALPDLGAEPRGVTALRAFIKLGGPVPLPPRPPSARGGQHSQNSRRAGPLRIFPRRHHPGGPLRLPPGPPSPRDARSRPGGPVPLPPRPHLGGPVPLPPRPPSARAEQHGQPWLEQVAPAGLRLLVVAGKGGVGKTSCAAALALALAERGRVLLLSTDPAHSLRDILDVAAAGGSIASPSRVDTIDVVELDAQAAFARRRARYRDAVNELFDTLRGGSRFDATFDRAVVQDLLDLAPSGLDEMFGTVGVIEALFPRSGGAGYDVVVLDTAPTGHALRLLEMPAAALEWVHALLAILLKYRKVIGLGELGADLVEIARDLRRLQTLLREPREARAVLVTRAAEVPHLETQRLRAGLRGLGVMVSGIVVNALTPAGCTRCRRAAAGEARVLDALRRAERSPCPRACAIIRAPAEVPPPRGVGALARWRDTWIPDSR